MKRLLSASAGFLLIIMCASAATPAYEWQVRRSPTGEHLYDVTYGDGMYVAVGNHRTIVTSRNGASWTLRARQAGSQGWFNRVAYGNGVFVAVGNGHQELWQLDSFPTFPPPGSAGYSTNTNSAPIVVSKDGVHWRGLFHGGMTVNAVVFGKGRFVAVGPGGTVGPSGIMMSRDGYNWLAATNPWRFGPDYPTHVAYGNGVFIVLRQTGAILRSTNGLDWSIYGRNLPDSLNGFETLVFNGSQFIAAPEEPYVHTMFASPRGIYWSEIRPPSFGVLALGYGRRQTTVAVGGDEQSRSWVQFSPDGLDWSARPTRITGTPYAITYGERGFVIVGARGLILQSTLPRSIPNSGVP